LLSTSFFEVPEVFAKKRYIATAAVGPCVFAKRTVNNHQIIYPNQKITIKQTQQHSNFLCIMKIVTYGHHDCREKAQGPDKRPEDDEKDEAAIG